MLPANYMDIICAYSLLCMLKSLITGGGPKFILPVSFDPLIYILISSKGHALRYCG